MFDVAGRRPRAPCTASTPADVELHEVGALDAIVDVVGIAAALHALGIERIVASPIAVGHGTTRSAHGQLPNPPPAVARLLAAARASRSSASTRRWSCRRRPASPSSSASPSAFGALPAMTVERVGYGAGTADPPGRPNVVQVSSARRSSRAPRRRPGRAAVQLEVNVDDVTGEVLAHTIAALLAAGAHDAWATPIVMKKGRPAHTVAALVDPADVERLAAVLLAETGSLGVRAPTVERWPQRRDEVAVDVDGHPVRVKVAGRAGQARARRRRRRGRRPLGRPLRDVLREAETRRRAATPSVASDAWARSRSATSGGGSPAAPSCCTTSASPSATATGRRSSAPTASASRR